MMKKNFIFIVVVFCFLLCLPSIARAETVNIIAEDDWYPYSGLQGDDLAGIAVDIVRAAFKAEGLEVQYDVMNYDRGMFLVKEGEAVGCFDAPRTEEIEKVYLWHDEPMFTGDSFFYARADYPGMVSTLKDLRGKKLGLTQGYGYGDAIDLNEGIDKEYSKTDEIILRKLIAGRVDFIVLYDKVADYLIAENGLEGQVKQAGPSESTGLYVAFSSKHPQGKHYRDIFNAGLKKMKADGTYAKIFKEWDEKLKGK